jgi:hypothetical protein
MALSDPPAGFDPLAEQYMRNCALRGYEHPGQQAEQLEREAQAQAVSTSGVRVVQVIDTSAPDEVLDVNARRAALNLPPIVRSDDGTTRHVKLGRAADDTGEAA